MGFDFDAVAVPVKDSPEDIMMRDVAGKKDDTSQTTVGTTRSLMSYIKGVLNQITTVITNLGTVDTVVDGIQTDLSNATDGLGALKTIIDLNKTELDEILELTRTDGDIAVTDSETDLYIDNAPAKIINGVVIKIDTSPIEAADTFVFKVYYRIASGGTLKASAKVTKAGVQSEPIYIIALDEYRYGMKITSQRTGGTNRTFIVEVIRET